MMEFEAGSEGIGVFNAIAIGLSVEILSGRVELNKNTPAYQQFLAEFAKYHPNFRPATWEHLRQWITYYNNPRDLELLLAPVLFNLNQVYRAQQDSSTVVLEELTQLIHNNKKIDDTTRWFNLKNTNLFPELDSLPAEARESILTKLKSILANYSGATLDEAKAFLSEQAGMLEAFATHIDLTTANYNRAYDTANLRLTSHLSFNLSNSLDRVIGKVNIMLRTKAISNGKPAGHCVWVATTKNYDEDILVDKSARRITDSSLPQAMSLGYQSNVPNFTTEQLAAHTGKKLKIVRQIIDNPGAGNCGFYAFAIGLIHIIQQEDPLLAPVFRQWCSLVPTLTQYHGGAASLSATATDVDAAAAEAAAIESMHKQLLLFDFKRSDKNTALLNHLQMGLRNCLYENRVRDLKLALTDPGFNNNNITANSTYLDFASVFYGQSNAIDRSEGNNIFADSAELVKQITAARNLIERSAGESDNEFDEKLSNESVACFIRSLYGADATLEQITANTAFAPELLAVQALANIKQDRIWATSQDLQKFASLFNVNYYMIIDGAPFQVNTNEDNLPTITLNNVRGVHWQTQISELQQVRDPLATQKNKSGTLSGTKTDSTGKALDVPLFMGKDNDDNLQQLKSKLLAATIEYTSYSENIWFSLFHRHGQTGRARAMTFQKRFNSGTDYDEARQELWNFLRNPANGNTHPHSYRTMVLHKLLADAYPQHSLQDTSRHYVKLLDELAASIDPYPALKL